MFNLVASLVVIGAVIAAVALTVGDPKPATEDGRPHRERRPLRAAARSVAGAAPRAARSAVSSVSSLGAARSGRSRHAGVMGSPPPPSSPGVGTAQPAARVVTVELQSPWQRARSAVLLVIVIAMVGAVVALVVGAALTLLGLSLREAVT